MRTNSRPRRASVPVIRIVRLIEPPGVEVITRSPAEEL
jgi:hypothetical protein